MADRPMTSGSVDQGHLARAPSKPTSGLALAGICVGYFMVILDTTVVNVALPSLGRDLHTGVTGLQWVVDGYTLVLVGFILSAGALGDRLGAKRVFQAGMVIFALASAACGVAPSIAVLIVARLVQGLGAAVAVPASLSLLQAALSRSGGPGPGLRDLGWWPAWPPGPVRWWAACSSPGSAGGPSFS